MDLPLPPDTTYDQVTRYLLVRKNPLLWHWLLQREAEQVRFDNWMPTQLTLPGVAERICDGIVRLTDLEHGGRPFAGILEIQTRPDATMPGRLMLAGGLCWLLVKPTPLPGDRYELLGVVINLTGEADAARCSILGGGEWILKPIEINLETLDASVVLGEIVGKQAPRELLALIPLMQRGDDPIIIQQWREVADVDTEPSRRSDSALAAVYAELVGRRPKWDLALEGFSMGESPLIAGLLANARGEGVREGKIEGVREGKIDTVVEVVKRRYKKAPEAMIAAIRASTDMEQLDRWLDLALKVRSLRQFRHDAGI